VRAAEESGHLTAAHRVAGAKPRHVPPLCHPSLVGDPEAHDAQARIGGVQVASVKKRTVWLTQNGRRVLRADTAWREGKTLSYTWTSFQQGSNASICVRFEGIRRVVCEKTRYIGTRDTW
jgi:hypothetical protein